MTSVERNAWIVGAIGVVLFLLGLLIDARQALASYVFAYATVTTLVIGALIQLMLSYVTGARWFVVMRRLTLDIVGAMPAVVILALPLFVGVLELYPWSAPGALGPEAQAIVQRKAAWLNVPFFIGRGVVYLAVWVAVAAVMRRWTVKQDHLSGAAVASGTRRLRRLSAGGLVAVGLTLTFASFDWLMSLEPTWFSTIYGVYVFSGGYLAALGLIAVLARRASGGGRVLDGVVTADHFGALGKLLLTFTIFWAYIAFSQFLIIWIGDVPLDASWYVVRGGGAWGILALVVAAGQFAIPFVLLLPRTPKRRPGFMSSLGWLLIVMHILDTYWLVLPAVRPRGPWPSWLDIAAMLMVGGIATAVAARRAKSVALLAVGDPYLPQSMRYIEP